MSILDFITLVGYRVTSDEEFNSELRQEIDALNEEAGSASREVSGSEARVDHSNKARQNFDEFYSGMKEVLNSNNVSLLKRAIVQGKTNFPIVYYEKNRYVAYAVVKLVRKQILFVEFEKIER